jgi:hypothetical protein
MRKQATSIEREEEEEEEEEKKFNSCFGRLVLGLPGRTPISSRRR